MKERINWKEKEKRKQIIKASRKINKSGESSEKYAEKKEGKKKVMTRCG